MTFISQMKLLGLAALITCLLCIIKPELKYKNKFVITTKTEYVNYSVKNFNKKEFIEYLMQIKVKFPDIVFAQATLECGFKSKMFKTKCNLFGMRVAEQRTSLGEGEPGEYAKFNNWKESVIDYALFQSEVLSHIETREEYFSFLQRRYAKDPKYCQKLKSIIKKQWKVNQ